MATLRRSYVDHVTCPICLDLLDKPRALPCMHTFCVACLHSHITSDFITGCEKGFDCPVCKTFTKPPFEGMHPYSWADNFPINFALKGLVEEMKTKQKRRRDTKNEGKEIVYSNLKCLSCKKDQERNIELECSDHCQSCCSMCAFLYHKTCININLLGFQENKTSNVTPDGQDIHENPVTLRKKHIAAIRRTDREYDKEETFQKVVDPKVLTIDFDHACSVSDKQNEDETFPKQIARAQHENTQTIEQSHTVDNRRVGTGDINARFITNTQKALSRLTVENPEDEGVDSDYITRHHNPNNNSDSIDHQRQNTSASLETDAANYVIENNNQQRRVLNVILEEDENIIAVSTDNHIPKAPVIFKKEFFIRTQYDEKCCSVSGMCVLPDERVLLADKANVNVKLFDSDGQYQNHAKLDSEPWDVTAIEQFEAAVSCPSSKCIYVLVIYDSLTVSRTINLNKCCYGIRYHKNELYIAMDDEIRIITYEGNVIQNIRLETSRRKILSWPIHMPKAIFKGAKYVDLNTDQSNAVIVVSDSLKVCVTSLNRHGTVLSQVKFDRNGVPVGICTGRKGKVYVCQESNKLVQVNSDEYGNRIKTILELDSMQAVHYHAGCELLWISRRANNFIRVYNVRK